MLPVVIALVLLAIAIGTIYLLLKKMGEEGVEIAAPGSCKSGRCGVRCAPKRDEQGNLDEALPDEAEESRR